MPVKNYYAVGGEMLGDSESGDYLRDALGSCSGTTDSNTGELLNTYRYKPFGAVLANIGSSSDPAFRHVGVLGIRETGLAHAEEYMRARHYSNSDGNFLTMDPWWPLEPAYVYTYNNPTTRVDPSGLGCPAEPPDPCKDCEKEKDLCKWFKKAFRGQMQLGAVICCGKRKQVCVNDEALVNLPPGDKAKIEKCIRANEEYHKNRPGACANPGTGLPSPCGVGVDQGGNLRRRITRRSADPIRPR